MPRPYAEHVIYKRQYQTHQVTTDYHSEALKKYVKARAKGNCEGCDTPAPFETKKGTYLEHHHVHRLATTDAAAFNQTLIEKLMGIEGKKLHLPTS
ncbi:hypothetical protein IFO68_21215 [Photobacterium sp. CAU 1568]|uniref:HNH endonuclease n=1 Tax=Photobacterium arenosum TaxID=2774143 RepID=A0ABR9BRT2_9GAMM|nr:hypothetical protein [Photobacterium arenosum]MBD8515202.1 hypothetical protein [Photobacterium arenosum]